MSEGREDKPAPEGDVTPDGRHDDEVQGSTITAENMPQGPTVVSAGTYRRLMSGMASYIMAMIACLLVVGLVILITPRRNENTLPRVDYRSDMAGLTAIAPYEAYVPQGIPASWHPTSTRLSGHAGGPISWHLGFYTPGKEYAALEESNETPEGPGKFVDRMTSHGAADGTVQVAGATWDRTSRADKKQRSLVRRLPGVTLIVTGTATYEELALLAGSLRAQPKASAAVTPTATPGG